MITEKKKDNAEKIVKTPEELQRERQLRVQEFQVELEALCIKYNYNLAPRIVIDIVERNNTQGLTNK